MCVSSWYFSYLSRIWTYCLFYKSSLAPHYQSEVSSDLLTCESRLPFKWARDLTSEIQKVAPV
jgi:hypothetical protein